MNFRISKFDRWNWTVERWVEPGSGPEHKKSKGRWKIMSYHNTLGHAARAAVDMKVGELSQEGRSILGCLEEVYRGLDEWLGVEA